MDLVHVSAQGGTAAEIFPADLAAWAATAHVDLSPVRLEVPSLAKVAPAHDTH